MNKILILAFVILLFPAIAHSDRINEFKTKFPELIGTWSFEASPAGKPVPYQMALWANKVENHNTAPLGILTWYTCRTGIAIYEIPKLHIQDYRITEDATILKKYDFFKISEKFIFKTGHCSNRNKDQWPSYLLREISTGKYYTAGNTIDTKKIKALEASIEKNKYELGQQEWKRRKAGMDAKKSFKIYNDDLKKMKREVSKKISKLKKAGFSIYSQVKRDRPDYNLAPALKYAEERLNNRAEIAHVREILQDPSAVYNSDYIASRKKDDLKEYIPHQPEKIVSVGNNRWHGIENGALYSAIINGTLKGYGPGEAYQFYDGYTSLVRGYGHYCKSTLKKWPTVSVNYNWVKRDQWGERSRKAHFNESVLMRQRYAKSFNTAFKDSLKTINVMGMMKGGPKVAMLMSVNRSAVQEKILSDAYKLIIDEGCNSPIVFQLLENYHRKLTNDLPYIQEVDKRMKKLK